MTSFFGKVFRYGYGTVRICILFTGIKSCCISVTCLNLIFEAYRNFDLKLAQNVYRSVRTLPRFRVKNVRAMYQCLVKLTAPYTVPTYRADAY